MSVGFHVISPVWRTPFGEFGKAMRQQGRFVFLGGAFLVVAGAYGMWSGWDHIQLERGWAQFIAGSVAIAGGAVTMGLARVIRAIERLAVPATLATEPAHAPQKLATATTEAAMAEFSAAVAPPPPAPPPPARPRLRPSILARPSSRPATPELKEVDRYIAGDAEYIMFSDGSVEVRNGDHSMRYESLAALRAEAARRM